MGALQQCWHSRDENFCQLKFVQLRPTGFWLHCGNVHTNHFEQSHPNIKTTTLVEKCLLCPGGDVVPWLCRWKSMLSQPTREMFAVNNAPTPEHCSERLPTCPQCLCVACNQFSWNWMGESRRQGLPHQWNIHTGPPLAAQPSWRVSPLRN